MANYSKATDFASKDALLSGDSNKIIKGSEINDEFDAIQTAVNSKANNNNTALTGVPTAPTAALGTSTAQLATTSFVQQAINALYPVGSIYINASNATNPAVLLGIGTWVAFGAGRVLVGLDGTDTSFDTAGETGGVKDAVVVSHTHGVTDPGHFHSERLKTDWHQVDLSSFPYYQSPKESSTFDRATTTETTGITIDSTGVSGTNANLQPYVVVYMWKRTA